MAHPMEVKTEGNAIILERLVDAPPALVFKVFSEAEHLKQWWGPRGWELTACNIDFRPGGVWHYCMKCMDPNQGDFYGFESWGKGIYEEIIAPEKIVYTDYFSDPEGNETEGMPSSRVTIAFEAKDGKTLIVNRSEFPSEEALKKVIEMGMEQGIRETWDRMVEHIETLV